MIQDQDTSKIPSVENDRSRDWAQYIEQARAGCNSALTLIVNRLESYLLMVATSRIGDSMQAKFGASDIVQMSLMEARESISNFRGSTETEIRIWLKQIVMNNLLDESKRFSDTQMRSIDRERSIATFNSIRDAGCKTPSTLIRRKESEDELKGLVEQLPFSQRTVVESRHRFGYSYAEIAQQMGISEANARKLWSRATNQLREWLDQSEEC